MTKLLFGALVVALVAAPLVTFAQPNDKSTTIVQPLREIEHVRATTAFCRAFSAGAAPAANAALAFENHLNLTEMDLNAFNAGNTIGRRRTIGLLEEDLRVLASDAHEGRSELATLRANSLPSTSEASKAVVAFADSLSGAQGRQMTLARAVARLVGTLEELPEYSIANTAQDQRYGAIFATQGFDRTVFAQQPGSALPFAEGAAAFTLPGDREIADDLVEAVVHARIVESLEHCM